MLGGAEVHLGHSLRSSMAPGGQESFTTHISGVEVGTAKAALPQCRGVRSRIGLCNLSPSQPPTSSELLPPFRNNCRGRGGRSHR